MNRGRYRGLHPFDTTIRAAEVPADYETKARKVDAKYNDWPYQRGGPPGPVLALLHSLPPVTGLGVGFAGEFSREVGQFISAVAEKGAVVPERFGCCHGSDQARGVIASFVRRAFGRTSLIPLIEKFKALFRLAYPSRAGTEIESAELSYPVRVPAAAAPAVRVRPPRPADWGAMTRVQRRKWNQQGGRPR